MQASTQHNQTGDPEATFEMSSLNIHMGIAEQGKLYALEGNHKLAMVYYREAMNKCMQAGDPELFFRVYLEAALESLEWLGMYEEVVAYCDRALALYEQTPPPDEMARLDLIYIHQKKGINLMKKGQKEEAQAVLKTAIDMMKKEGHPLPLASAFLRWLASGFHLDEKRMIAEQQKNQYFSVRKDTVNPERAIKLPDGMIGPMQ